MNRTDVAIAGAGIIGLTTALELAAAGCKVTVFDRSEAMSEASRAAAGMLAGADPENPVELRELAGLSLARYPEFLRRVEELSHKKISIRTTRTLQGVHHLPSGAKPLTEAEIQEQAPSANIEGLQFLLLEEKSFDAWDLAEALPAAARAVGVDLREHTSVLSARSGSGAVEIVTAAGTFSAGLFLNAIGAWAPTLEPAVPVTPRKGHMLTAELPGEVQMQCVLRTPNVYIVPRGANRYTVGPTVEDAGFDRNVDPLRIKELFSRAVELWPPLRDAAIAETWIGFRPGSGDGLPIIDQTAENCWIATGHFKNGILLGPGTGRIVSQWMLGQQPEIDLSPFRCGRFALSASSS
jgi:glycine oxidase